MMMTFDLDWGVTPVANELDINAVVRESEKKERVLFDFENGTKQLSYLLRDFDKRKEYRFISNGKGFSAINFIDYIAKTFGEIENLYVSTLRVGEKHILHLDTLPIDKAFFVFCGIFYNKNEYKYKYFDVFQNVCKKRGWSFVCAKNHSKIILMKTAGGGCFVLETSANLNENPKIEQFTFQCDKGLFEWYERFFLAVKNHDSDADD